MGIFCGRLEHAITTWHRPSRSFLISTSTESTSLTYHSLKALMRRKLYNAFQLVLSSVAISRLLPSSGLGSGMGPVMPAPLCKPFDSFPWKRGFRGHQSYNSGPLPYTKPLISELDIIPQPCEPFHMPPCKTHMLSGSGASAASSSWGIKKSWEIWELW